MRCMYRTLVFQPTSRASKQQMQNVLTYVCANIRGTLYRFYFVWIPRVHKDQEISSPLSCNIVHTCMQPFRSRYNRGESSVHASLQLYCYWHCMHACMPAAGDGDGDGERVIYVYEICFGVSSTISLLLMAAMDIACGNGVSNISNNQVLSEIVLHIDRRLLYILYSLVLIRDF